MSFTYNDDETADRDKVRGTIQDTIERQGPLPDGRNFSNEVIDSIIALEQSWQRAVANLYERLQAAYANKATTSVNAGGMSTSYQYSNQAAEYRRLATEWRNRYGYYDDETDAVDQSVQVGVFGYGFQETNVTS